MPAQFAISRFRPELVFCAPEESRRTARSGALFANARHLLPIFTARLVSIERRGDTIVNRSSIEGYVAILASQTGSRTTLPIALDHCLAVADADDEV